jgi:ribonuclease P protein subunit RPR2
MLSGSIAGGKSWRENKGCPLVCRRRRRDVVRDIAKQRAMLLYSLAIESVREGKIERARNYVELGMRILMKARVRKPTYYRRWVCENCHVPLVPGLTVSVRVKGTKRYLLITKRCLLCGWINRTAVSKRESSWES